MHTLLRTMGLRTFLIEEGISLGAALVIAELFYKFHSFLLESLAFLATWYVLSWLGSRMFGVPAQKHEGS